MKEELSFTSSRIPGTDLRNIDTFRAVASELDVPSVQLSVCHTMMLEDVKDLPSTHR